MERAGFYPRFAAFLCDLLLFFVVTHMAVALDAYAYLTSFYSDFGVIAGGFAALFVIGFALLEVMGLASPGKRFLRLMIAADDGTLASTRMLLRRVAVKYMPALLVLFPAVLLSLTDPYGPSFPSVVQYGLTVVAVIGSAFAVAVMLLVTAGCFRALRPDGRAMHDMASGTAVFFRPQSRTRGFTPIISTAVVPIPGTTPDGTAPDADNSTPSADAGTHQQQQGPPGQ